MRVRAGVPGWPARRPGTPGERFGWVPGLAETAGLRLPGRRPGATPAEGLGGSAPQEGLKAGTLPVGRWPGPEGSRKSGPRTSDRRTGRPGRRAGQKPPDRKPTGQKPTGQKPAGQSARGGTIRGRNHQGRSDLGPPPGARLPGRQLLRRGHRFEERRLGQGRYEAQGFVPSRLEPCGSNPVGSNLGAVARAAPGSGAVLLRKKPRQGRGSRGAPPR